MIPMSIYEKAILHVPLSIVYHFFMSVGQLTLFYKTQDDKKDHMTFVLENKIFAVIFNTVGNIMVQYAACLIILYMRSQIYLIVN